MAEIDRQGERSAPSQTIEEGLDPAISDLPPEKREAIVAIVSDVVLHHSGPLPHPRTLAAYEAILPGVAERIITMAEVGLKQRHELRMATLSAGIAERRIGQLSALAIMLGALVLSGWITAAGQPIAGGLLGGATLLGVISVFIGGREYLLRRLPPERGPPTTEP